MSTFKQNLFQINGSDQMNIIIRFSSKHKTLDAVIRGHDPKILYLMISIETFQLQLHIRGLDLCEHLPRRLYDTVV